MKRRRIVAAAFVCVLIGATAFFVPRIWQRLCHNWPLSFHGRIIDENGIPLRDVRIEFQMLYSTQLALPVPFSQDERVKKLVVYSDEHGNFELTSVLGYSVSLTSMTLKGQELQPVSKLPATTFRYDTRYNRARFPDAASKRIAYALKLQAKSTTTRIADD